MTTSKRKARIPSYRLHKQSGQGIVTLPDGNGGRKDVLLGNHGTPESLFEYKRVVLEWEAGGMRSPNTGSSAHQPGLSINEVALAYFRHVESYYRLADGSPTTEVHNIRLALRPLKAIYGRTNASEFDALALDAIREQMIQEGHCRNRVNKDVARLKRLFRWAGSKKLVPGSVYQDLNTLEGLKAGRSAARETAPVQPVPRQVVEQTLLAMRPTLASMVRLQLETGMRPGEVCAMRVTDIDMSASVWLYRPTHHKTAHHGHGRIVPIGPRAQDLIRAKLKTNPEAFLFTPADTMTEYRAEKRAGRKSKVQPSQVCRAKRRPKRKPGTRYSRSSYANAVADACNRAFPPPDHLRPSVDANGKRETHKEFMARLTATQKDELRAWKQEHRWHPHQLRHTRAAELKRQAGLDVARAVLGHRSPVITEHYAGLDLAKATEVMAIMG